MAMLAVGVLSALSVWQVERAWYKLRLAQEVQDKQSRAPADLNRMSDLARVTRYQPVSVTGRFEKKDYVLIDNSIHQGRAGYQVVAPLRLEGGNRHVLVYLGWAPQGRTRADLPPIELPEGRVTVHGRLDAPASRPLLVSGDRPNPEFEKVWMYMDTGIFAKNTGYDVMPLVVYESPGDPGNYVRDWPKFDAKVGMHVGYAIQWAVFALVALGLYIWSGLKKETKQDG